MKKFISILLCLMCIVASVCTVSASDTNTKIKVDGEIVSLVAYNINDNNYFKLRDIANILKGTEAHFDVYWNAEKSSIEIRPFQDYSTDEEITTEKIENPEIVKSNALIYREGTRLLLNAYNINGNTFFKLRDLASAIDFGVNWIAEENIIEINSNESYVHPEYYGDELAVNTELLTLFGKNKGYVDTNYNREGTGFETNQIVYDQYEFTVIYEPKYSNDVLLEPYPLSQIVGLEMMAHRVLYNCPDYVSPEAVAALFPEHKFGTNEKDNVNYLTVNYCGCELTFWYAPGSSISKYDSVSIDVNTPYVSDNSVVEDAVMEGTANMSSVGIWKDEKMGWTLNITYDGEYFDITATLPDGKTTVAEGRVSADDLSQAVFRIEGYTLFAFFVEPGGKTAHMYSYESYGMYGNYCNFVRVQ